MTTSAGLLGVINGIDGLPELIRDATDVYFNEDLTGDLPQFDSVANIAARTVAIGELVTVAAGGNVENGLLRIPGGS